MLPLMNSLTKCTDSAEAWDTEVPVLSALEREVRLEGVFFFVAVGVCLDVDVEGVGCSVVV